MTQKRITDNLTDLLSVLPPEITSALEKINRPDDLLEIILDLGRTPTARYTDGEFELSEREVTAKEIDYVVSRIGDYDADNRAGIERTLHRISAIRNRHREISRYFQRNRRGRRRTTSSDRSRSSHAGARTYASARGYDRGCGESQPRGYCDRRDRSRA